MEQQPDITTYVDYLCFTHQRHHILALRKLLGDALFLKVLDKFCGMYVRFPTKANADEVGNDVRLATLYGEVQEASKRTVSEWNAAEQRFIKFSSHIGFNYDRAVRRARAVQKELQRAKVWLIDLEHFEARKREDVE